MTTPVRIVIADDHPVVLRGLEALLQAERDFQVAAQCQDGEEALAAVIAHRPDIAVLDLRMPRKSGLEVLREVAALPSPPRSILLVAALSDEELLEAIRLGVRGVLLKEMALRLLVQCIRKVHQGEPWIERRSAAHAFETLLRRESGVRQLSELLTPRQLQIVRCVATGLSNAAVAEALHVGEGTVKTHLHAIYEKLGLRSRAELIVYCQQRGIT